MSAHLPANAVRLVHRAALSLTLLVLSTAPLQAGMPVEIQERLLKLKIHKCEAATFETVARALRPDLANGAALVRRELERLPRGVVLVASVTRKRAITWPFLQLITPGTPQTPRAQPWEVVSTPEESTFFYISERASCPQLLREPVRILSSRDNADCDTAPPAGLCIFDAQRIVRFVPAESSRFTKPAP